MKAFTTISALLSFSVFKLKTCMGHRKRQMDEWPRPVMGRGAIWKVAL